MIKGLIVKDLLQLKSYKRTLIVYVLIFFLTAVSQENTKGIGYMLVVMMILGFGMFAIASFFYDEQARADRYLLALPLTKKDIVREKYVFVILSTIVGMFLGILGSFLVLFFVNREVPDILKLLSIGFGGLLGVGVVESIQIPCIYQFGAEKGRIYMFIAIAIVSLLLGGVAFLLEIVNIELDGLLSFFESFIPFLCSMVLIVFYFISYQISYKIFLKKEI